MKINSVRAFYKTFLCLGVSFMMISCDENNPCSNIKNGLYYKKSEHIDKIHIDKINKEDFEKNYSKQYAELIGKIKDLYENYRNDGGQEKNEKGQEGNNEDSESDDEYNPPEDFIKRVRGIVEQNEKIYEETYKHIDKYTRKIPPMPWAFGCTIKGLVMYILHNPIIKCAVQYFDNYKYTRDETGKTFDEMVMDPKKPIDEWHNCLVTFIRLLKLTYEELESDNDVKVHCKLWNQIQGLEYLLHFLCFGYRRGWFCVTNTINFLKVFLNILGVFDFSVDGDVFSQGDKKLEYRAYFSYRTGLDEQVCGNYEVSKEYSDFICSKEREYFFKNISNIISKSNRTNWIIHDVEGKHVFHFYLCKNEDETVYYIHDGWYEYQDFINRKLPKPDQKYYHYSIPFTYIILPTEVSVKKNRVININNVLGKYEFGMQFWDSLIPLLSTNLKFVEKYCEKLYTSFEYSNGNEREVLFEYFLNYLDNLISSIVEAYNHFKLDKNQGEFEFNDSLKYLITSEVDGVVFPKDEKNIDIVEIDNYYYSNENEIDTRYPDEIDRKQRKNVENEKKYEHMLELLMKTKNKIGWFLRKKNVVDLIVEYHPIRNKTELQVAFIEKNIKEIPVEIDEMFKVYVKKYFSNISEVGKDFAFENLVHGENGANGYYDRKGKYKQADVLKVNWTTAGLKEKDLPIFRGKFKGYEFFKSAQFSDVVK